MSTRLLVLGLDGASWRLTQRLVAEGWMPTLGRLMGEGASGPLTSTIPAISSTAWASFMTGRDPGEHGIFGFGVKPLSSYYLKPFTALGGVRGRTLWTLLSDYGQRVAVMNVPVTYPPEQVNGILISGFGTPDHETAFTHPPELSEEVRAHFGSCLQDLEWTEYEKRGMGALLTDARAMTRKRADYALHWLERENWDFFMLVLVSTDRLQHVFWHLLEPGEPLSSEQDYWRRQALDYYTYLDGILAEFVERAANANILVLSDHGFGHSAASVYLNTWLAQAGYLRWASVKHPVGMKLVQLARKLGLRASHVQPVLRKLGMDEYRQLERFSAQVNQIDWENTKAFSYSPAGIYLNLRGRERKGSVDPGPEAKRLWEEMAGRLLALRDPVSGVHLITRVARPEEVYRGSRLPHAPDLVFAEQDSRYVFLPNLQPTEEMFVRSRWRSGLHDLEGILIAHGPRVSPGQASQRARLIDLFPTILALLDQPVPEDTDGRVLTELFRSAPKVQTAARMAGDGTEHGQAALSPEEEELLMKRLQGLGYLE